MAICVSLVQKTVSKQGRRTKTRTWYLFYRDRQGKQHFQATGVRDKFVAKQLAARLERELALGWTGLADPFAKHRERSLLEHVDDWAKFLGDKGNCSQYVVKSKKYVTALVTGCRFSIIADVSKSKVVGWLAELREAGASISTSNHYGKAMKQFCKFLVDDDRLAKNPLGSLSVMRADGDRRRVRRTLTGDEFARLIEVTANNGEIFGFSGVDRALLYLLAANSGLRRGEIGSLTGSSFDFDAPSVVVAANADKSGRQNPPIPLRPAVAQQLQAWIALRGFGADDLLWPFPNARAAEMLQRDLAAAGIAYCDARGRVFDFHSLRGQYITDNLNAGVPLPLVQKLARHSVPMLTSNYYYHPAGQQIAAQLEKLPAPPTIKLPAPKTETSLFTGAK